MEIRLPVAAPPWKGLGKRLESACRKALYDFKMLEHCNSIAVALSGGKDSLALLFLLHAIRGKGFPPFALHAIHISGEFSCGAGVNADYLKGICKHLGIDLIIKKSDRKLEDLECYSCSRERRNLIFNAAKEAGATTIAFGHHRDDNAQTLLMNLLQKGEFAGNLPKIEMIKYGITIIRPLIYIAEQDIRTFAGQYGFARITCQCPVGQHSTRKQVDRLLDEIEHLFPQARQNIADASLNYGSDKAKKEKKTS